MGVAFFTSTESIRSSYVGRSVQHELAVQSLLAALPELLKAEENGSREGLRERIALLEIAVGPCRVVCSVRAEKDKLIVRSASTDAEITGRMAGLAATNNLPGDNIQPRPILENDDTRGWPGYVWFDQLIRPTEFEELFQWRPLSAEGPDAPQKPWSALISFWADSQEQLLSLDIQTTIGVHVRRWYAVCAAGDQEVTVHFLGAA
jgi:hypothetical protein